MFDRFLKSSLNMLKNERKIRVSKANFNYLIYKSFISCFFCKICLTINQDWTCPHYSFVPFIFPFFLFLYSKTFSFFGACSKVLRVPSNLINSFFMLLWSQRGSCSIFFEPFYLSFPDFKIWSKRSYFQILLKLRQ